MIIALTESVGLPIAHFVDPLDTRAATIAHKTWLRIATLFGHVGPTLKLVVPMMTQKELVGTSQSILSIQHSDQKGLYAGNYRLYMRSGQSTR